VTRRVLAVLVGLALASAPAPRAQDWRTAAVRSFDDVWQTINDTFPDPAFGGLDWAAVARELRPGVEAAATPDDARDVIRRMLARLNRSHFVLLSTSPAEALRGPADVPADVRITADGALITRVTNDAAARDGLAPGQVILSIDGTDTAALVGRADGADPRTRRLHAWRLVTQRLSGADGSRAALVVRGADGVRRELEIERAVAPGDVVTLGNLPPLRVAFERREARTPQGRRAGVIWFSVWMTAVSDPFEKAIDAYRSADGLVIDLRGNPGGLAAMMRGLAGHVIDTPLLLGTMHTRQADLSFIVNPRLATSDGRAVRPFAGPVALLVDELTGSTSETFAGALQSLGRARVFGRPTMGQALPAFTKPLPNGDVLMYAVGDFMTSSGKRIEGDGVIPDEVLELSAPALAGGHDEPLEAALRWIDARGRGPGTEPVGGRTPAGTRLEAQWP
jgi:carboxyl-terminal processing protease